MRRRAAKPTAETIRLDPCPGCGAITRIRLLEYPISSEIVIECASCGHRGARCGSTAETVEARNNPTTRMLDL